MADVDNRAPDESGDVVTVLVTGFGSFLDTHTVNPSWRIASTLPSIIPADNKLTTPVRIIVHPWPVKVGWKAVEELVPPLLSSTTPKPDVILHVGLAEVRTFYAMERQSCRDDFHKLEDVDGKKLTKDEVDVMFSDCPHVLKPDFEIPGIMRQWRSSVDYRVDVRTSHDPGNFLCGFIYFCSMAYFYKKQKSTGQVMFLHVPNLVSEEAIAEGRAVTVALIKALVQALHQSNGSDTDSGIVVPKPHLVDSGDQTC